MTTPVPDKAAETRALLAAGGGPLRVAVAGGCMRPTLATGQVVTVRPPPPPPRVGDVVLMDASGWLEIHRLVGRVGAGGRSWFVHMGDASPICGVASADEILGVVLGAPARRAPALRAHLLTLLYRLGALLLFLGLAPSRLRRRAWAAAAREALFRSDRIPVASPR